MSDVVLRLKDVSKTYKKGLAGEVDVLRGVD